MPFRAATILSTSQLWPLPARPIYPLRARGFFHEQVHRFADVGLGPLSRPRRARAMPTCSPSRSSSLRSPHLLSWSRPSVSTTPRPYHPGSNDGPQPRRFVYALGRRNDLLGKRVHHYHRGFLNSVPGGGSSVWSSSLPLVRARQRMLKPIKWSGATCVAEQKRHASQH